MKNITKLLGVYALAAIIGLSGCVKDGANIDKPDTNNGKATMTIKAGQADLEGATRTEMYDGYQIKWVKTNDKADQIGVFAYVLCEDDGKYHVAKNYPYTICDLDDETRIAEFTGDYDTFEGTPFMIEYHAYHPYCDPEISGIDPRELTLELPAMQKPTATSFDGCADILFGEPILTESLPIGQIDGGKDLNFVFQRPFAIGSFKFTNIPAKIADPSAEEIESVMFTFNGASDDVAGEFLANLHKHKITFASNEKSIILHYDAGVATLDNFTAHWIMNAVSITGFDLEIETTNYIIEKSFVAGLEFKPNTVLKSTDVRLTDAEVTDKTTEPEGPAAIYTLVNSAAGVTSGEYLIVAKNSNKYYTFNEQKESNIGAKEIPAAYYSTDTFTDDALNFLHNMSVNITKNGQDYTIQANRPDITGKYFYAAASGSNHLKTRDKNTDDKGVWTISDSDTAPLLSITAKADDVRPDLRFNWNNGIPLFSCYLKTSDNFRVSLYKKTGATTPEPATLGKPTNLTSSNVEIDSFQISWDAVYGALGYQVALDEGTWSETITATSAEFAAPTHTIEENTEYTVKVKAIGNGSSILNSEAAIILVKTKTEGGASVPTYVKVSSALTDYSGSYLIIYETKSLALSHTAKTAGQNMNGENVSSKKDENAYIFDIEPAFEYTITKEESGTYLIHNSTIGYLTHPTAAKNHLKGTETPDAYSHWTISRNTDGTFDITNPRQNSNKSYILQWNDATAAGGGQIFSCYTSNQKKPTLYKKE